MHRARGDQKKLDSTTTHPPTHPEEGCTGLFVSWPSLLQRWSLEA